MNPRALRTALLRGRRRPRSLGGGSPTSLRGDGLEFIEVRAYEPGDDPRRIDWAASARSNMLQTRVVLEDVALTLAAILDDSASMQVGRMQSLLESGLAALAAWYAAAAPEDRCTRIGAESPLVPVHLRGRTAAGASLHARDSAAFNLGGALHTALVTLPRGSALLLITDLFDEIEDALLARVALNFDATLLFTRDPWWEEFPLRGFVTLRDAQNSRTERLFVDADFRRRYHEQVRVRERDVRARCTQMGWRVGLLIEGEGERSLYAAFGLAELSA